MSKNRRNLLVTLIILIENALFTVCSLFTLIRAQFDRIK